MPKSIRVVLSPTPAPRSVSGEQQRDNFVTGLEVSLQMLGKQKTLATKGMSAVQRERISYELGLALDASGAPSCEHWRDHVARFGTARNTRTLEARLARCERE
jgi:hypothetical protein